MADHSRFMPRPLYRRDFRWEPFCEETLPGRIYRADAGLPPFLEPGDLSWIQWAQRRMAASSWPGYMPAPLYTSTPPYYGLGAEQPRGFSEIRTGPDSWKINLDVSCFSPREVSIKTREGYLEISGNHEDRQNDYGLVSKCFSRKYRLPAGVDLRHIRSALSGGVLSVEAPLPSVAQEIPVEIIIPVKVEKRAPETREETKVGETAHPDISQENSERSRATSVFPVVVQEKKSVIAVPQAGIQKNKEETSEVTVHLSGGQEMREEPSESVNALVGYQENRGQLGKLTSPTERASSSTGVEPEEDRPMGGEVRGDEAPQEEGSAKREAMLTEQANNQDGVGQEGQDHSQTEAPGSVVDGEQVEEKKQLEGRWSHRDTKWMLRSTKWPSQQF